MIKTGRKYIKLLGVINIVYILTRVLINMESYSFLSITNAIITALINLLFGLGLVYAIYKKKNGARFFLSGMCILGLIANIKMYVNGRFDINQTLSIVYAVMCLFILSRVEVIDYMRSSGKSV